MLYAIVNVNLQEIDESGDDDGVGFVDADELKGVELEWTVGGAFQVNTTQVVHQREGSGI